MAYQKRLSNLGPAYFGCNDQQSTCTRRDALPRQGCPDCEYTIQTRQFEERLGEALRSLKQGTRKGNRDWTPKKMINTVIEIGNLAMSHKGIQPEWAVPVSVLVSIYRDESAKLDMTESFNQKAIPTGRES